MKIILGYYQTRSLEQNERKKLLIFKSQAKLSLKDTDVQHMELVLPAISTSVQGWLGTINTDCKNKQMCACVNNAR